MTLDKGLGTCHSVEDESQGVGNVAYRFHR